LRRRPQPSPRRGIIRAGLVVVVLTALLVAVLIVVSTATAPPAHAPVIPFTPPPVHQTSLPLPTTRATAPLHRTATPATVSPVPRPTASSTKPKQSLGKVGTSQFLSERSAGNRLRKSSYRSRRRSTSQSAYFIGLQNAYHGSLLYVRSGSQVLKVGPADPFVRPVWTPSGKSVLYVSVSASGLYPKAVWSLWSFDVGAHHSYLRARTRALGLTPLGQAERNTLYIVTRPTDTSVYSVSPGKASHFVTILIPQPIVAAWLSPGARYIAFSVPTACTYCTLDVFDLNQNSLWIGPTGSPSEDDTSWSADGRTLVTALNGRLAVLQPGGSSERTYSWPRGLPRIWPQTMIATLSPDSVRLTDTVSGRVFQGR